MIALIILSVTIITLTAITIPVSRWAVSTYRKASE